MTMRSAHHALEDGAARTDVATRTGGHQARVLGAPEGTAQAHGLPHAGVPAQLLNEVARHNAPQAVPHEVKVRVSWQALDQRRQVDRQPVHAGPRQVAEARGVRAGLAAAEVVPDDLMAAVNKQVEEGSPLGMTDSVWDQRLEWIADEWEEDIPRDVQGADTMVVFSSIEVMKFPTNVAAIAKILNKAGEKWTVSSKAREIVNFGFYQGDEKNTKMFLDRVLEGARDLGVKRIVVTECGHAYDALRWHGANWLPEANDFEIIHITGVLGELVGNGRIKLKPGAFDGNGTITFHDACKIQRKGGHIQEPRDILKVIAPNSFKEMTPNREEAICCGGGGGVIAIKAADPQRYAAFGLKIDQVNSVGAKTVTMTCSNCRLQFTDGVEHFKLDWKVTGLAQMVADSLVE